MGDVRQQMGSDKTAIRQFRVNVSGSGTYRTAQAHKGDKVAERETVGDESQGVQLETVQNSRTIGATEYDWRACEARLNALPRSSRNRWAGHSFHSRAFEARQRVAAHRHAGWPGSIIEQMKIIDPLTNPTAHGATASDASTW